MALEWDKLASGIPMWVVPLTVQIQRWLPALARIAAFRRGLWVLMVLANYSLSGNIFWLASDTMPSETLTEPEIRKYVASHGITDPQAAQKIKEDLEQRTLPGFEAPYKGSGILRDYAVQRSPGEAALPKASPSEVRRRNREAFERSRGQTLKSLHSPEKVAEAFKSGDVISSILPKYIKGDVPTFNIVGAIIEKPEDFAKLTWMLRTPYMEVLKVAFLNRDGKVLHSAAVGVGTINAALISPQMILREVQNIAVKTKSNRVILSHNHPSGDPRPSADDIRSTNVLVEGLKVAGIELIDHVVTNGKTFSSWKNGWAISNVETPQPQWEIVPRSELPKIQEPAELAKIVATLRQADPNHDHVIYGDTKLQVAAVERLSTTLSIDELARKISLGSGREGGPHVWFESAQRGTAEIKHLYDTLEKVEIRLLDASTTSIPSCREHGLMEPGQRMLSGATSPTLRLVLNGETILGKKEILEKLEPLVSKYCGGKKESPQWIITAKNQIPGGRFELNGHGFETMLLQGVRLLVKEGDIVPIHISESLSAATQLIEICFEPTVSSPFATNSMVNVALPLANLQRQNVLDPIRPSRLKAQKNNLEIDR